jgi:hypothetical protein
MTDEVPEVPRMNERAWSNVHAELIKSIRDFSVDHEGVQYAPVKTEKLGSDNVMANGCSEYVLRLAATIRAFDAKSKKFQKLADSELDLRIKEEIIGILDIIEIHVDAFVSLYFLQLHMEFPDWKGAPLFTLRDHNTVVVTHESIKRLKRRASLSYNLNEHRLYFRQLALSPIVHVKKH